MARMQRGIVVTISLLFALTGNFTRAGAGCHRTKASRAEHEYFFNHLPTPVLNQSSLPRHFSWCHHPKGKNLCTPNWNQHIPIYCGGCWMHGPLSMINDRLNIIKDGAFPQVMLSRQTLLNCAGFHGWGNGCNGGEPIDLYTYMRHYGLPDETCQHYNARDHHQFSNSEKHAERCPSGAYCRNCMPVKGKDTCWGVRTPIRYFVRHYGKVAQGEQGMMSEIYSRGPITCSMAAPEEAFDYGYRAGVYMDKTNATKVTHDVELVGWGETKDGLKWWQVRNSWGSYWGELGFFRIERGVNSLRIEEDCSYAIPEHRMEQEVKEGKWAGSMDGLVRWGKEAEEGFEATVARAERNAALRAIHALHP